MITFLFKSSYRHICRCKGFGSLRIKAINHSQFSSWGPCHEIDHIFVKWDRNDLISSFGLDEMAKWYIRRACIWVVVQLHLDVQVMRIVKSGCAGSDVDKNMDESSSLFLCTTPTSPQHILYSLSPIPVIGKFPLILKF
jgi:hypothetical protein